MKLKTPLFFSVLMSVIIILLTITGLITGINQFIISTIPIISISLVVISVVNNKPGLTFGSSIAAGLLVGAVILFWNEKDNGFPEIFGTLLISFGASCLILYLIFMRKWRQTYWWLSVPAGLGISLGACFLLSAAKFIDFIFYIGIGLGAALLFWGIGAKLLGLIIAGSVVISVAPGVTFSWKSLGIDNPISQTGVMLVWFGLGWALITISSRVISDKFTWWPLVPGGILGMVGLGLYLGGNPNITESFLTNSTLMSLLLFGIYIILMRINFTKIK